MTDSDDLPFVHMTSDVVPFIDALDKSYPARCIRADEDVISAHRYAAIREFIDELLLLKVEYLEGMDNEDSGDDAG
jgi:hypothetical protein